MKRKKSGSVAIPFLLTFLISLIIIGGIAMYIYGKINNDESSLLTMTNEAGTLSEEDNHTILFILDLSDSLDIPQEDSEDEYYEDEYYDEEDEETFDWEVDETKSQEAYPQAYTFLVMRSQPVDKRITFMGIQSDMLAGEENKPVEDIYLSGSNTEVKTAIEYTLGIEIDRYMKLDSESFKKICNILGGVTFAVPGGISGLPQADGEQYLSPDQIEKIISFGGYSGGETQRISTVSSLITAMLNQTNGKRISENLDNSFETIINMTESDISAVDYNNRKYAIKFMLKYSDPEDSESRSSRAQFITPYGTQKDEGFIVDNYFTDDIKAYFDEYNSNNSGENSVSEGSEENE